MGKPKPTAAGHPAFRGQVTSLRPEGASARRAPKSRADHANQLIGVILTILLAVTMLPATGLQQASADEPVERPETSGGDVALESANGGASDADEAQAPVAQQREDGMQVADGLVYTVADAGLALVGFDLAEGADAKSLVVPATIVVDGRETPVVAVDIAEGNVIESVVALALPQSLRSIDVASLAPAFPGLLSVEVAPTQGASLPAAAGAAAMRAAYSSFGGALLGQATVGVEREDGSVEPVQCRELLWAPPAMVVARVPVDCLSIAPGALADASGLETIVCFGDVQRIAAAERDDAGSVTVPGALTDDQLASVTVVFPDATPAVPSEGDGRVSASMALNDGATQTDKRHAWIALGLPLDRLSMGKPVGALTETVAVTEEGAPASDEAQLISYPGMHPKATDVKHPGEDGTIDMAESGLAYEMKSDMTLSVRWEGDITATPAHLEIPAYATIDGVKYPVTEIAPEAFKGAVFLASVTIPETVKTIGDAAFEDCPNLEWDAEPIPVPHDSNFLLTDIPAAEFDEITPYSTYTYDGPYTAQLVINTGIKSLTASFYRLGSNNEIVYMSSSYGVGTHTLTWYSRLIDGVMNTDNIGLNWISPDLGYSGNMSVTCVTTSGASSTASTTGYYKSPSNPKTITVSASWVGTNTVSYNANGGSGSVSSQTVTKGSGVTVAQNGFKAPETWKVFDGWNTAANGSGTSYSPGSGFTPSGNVTLYAQWKNNMRFIVDGFMSNGGSGDAPDGIGEHVVGVWTLPECSFAPPDAHYIFAGWYTDENCSGTLWKPGSSFVPEVDGETVTFYAGWIPKVINVSIQLGNTPSQTVFWDKDPNGYATGSSGDATDANSTGLAVKFKNNGDGVNYAAKLAQIRVYDAGASDLFDLAPDGTGPAVFSLSDASGNVKKFGFKSGSGAYTVPVGEGFEVPADGSEVTFTLGCDLSEYDIDLGKVSADMGDGSTYTAPLVKVVYVFEPAGL